MPYRTLPTLPGIRRPAVILAALFAVVALDAPAVLAATSDPTTIQARTAEARPLAPRSLTGSNVISNASP